MITGKEADYFYAIKEEGTVPDSGQDKFKVTPKSDADLFYAAGATRKGGIYDSSTQEGLDKMSDHLGLTNAQREDSRAASAKLFYELDVNPNEAAKIHSVFTRNIINPPDAETIKNWEVEARSRWRQEYGDRAESLMAKTRAYVAKAGMKDVLNKTGIGSDPDTVMTLIDHVARLARK